MKHLLFQKKGIVLFLCLILFFSCGGKVTTRPTPTKFTINGVVVKDMSLGKDIAYFAILRDGNPFGGAVVKVGNDTLVNQGNGNYYLEGFPLFSFGQTISFIVSSPGDDFNLSHSVKMPGSFQITAINPPVVTIAEAEEVKIYGYSSAGASGYLINIIRPNGDNGYDSLASAIEINQGAQIPRYAFGDGGDFITGTYKVFLVAYRTSFIEYPGMAFYLPDGLPIANNIPGADGTISAGVVASSVSIKAE